MGSSAPPPSSSASDLERSPASTDTTQAAGAAGRMVADSCTFCGVAVAVDATRPLHLQHCHACGRRLRKQRRKKKRHELAGFTPEGLLEKRTRERVWMPMTGVALVTVLAAVFGLWMFYRPVTKPAGLAPVEPPGRQEEIKMLFERFMAARIPEELLPLIREPERFEKPLREWCAAHPGGLPLGGELLRIVTKQVGDTPIAETAMQSGTVPDRNLLFVETQAGWRLDWRAFAGLGDLSFQEFIAKKPTAPTLLLTVARVSDYYNGTYSNTAVWQCLHLSDDSGEHILYAYVARRNVALMEKIARLEPVRSPKTVELNRVSRSLALRVHTNPAGAVSDPLQVEVDAVEGEGWFIP